MSTNDSMLYLNQNQIGIIQYFIKCEDFQVQEIGQGGHQKKHNNVGIKNV